MIPLLSIANTGRYASLALVVPGLPCYLAVANGSPIDWLWSLNWRRNSIVPPWTRSADRAGPVVWEERLGTSVPMDSRGPAVPSD
jgi:hypothetical protein